MATAYEAVTTNDGHVLVIKRNPDIKYHETVILRAVPNGESLDKVQTEWDALQTWLVANSWIADPDSED